MRGALVFGTLLASLVGGAGCVFIDPGHDCYGDSCGTVPGDIGFYWSFELPEGGRTESCLQAGAARMDIRLYDQYGERLEFEVVDRPCGDQGAILTDFWPGSYVLQLAARCRDGGVGYVGWFDLWVGSGFNEFGTLTLEPRGGCS
jgi:hypothetical protein